MSANRGCGIVIVGAGPTGLGAAWYLHQHGLGDWILLEKDDVAGGLARSFVDGHGFTWDIGGHVVFSHYELFTSLLDGLWPADQWCSHNRESWIRMPDCWVPYPFQNNLHRLAPQARADCIGGLVEAALKADPGRPENFEQFLVRTFGPGICAEFMRPYNLKVWGRPLSELSWEWIGDRVSVPDPVRAVRNLALGQDDVGWGPNSIFRFPKHGGTGAIWNASARTLPQNQVRYGSELTGLDVANKTLRLADGEQLSYSHLLSTIPLDRLAGLTKHPRWVDAAGALRHSSTRVIGLALQGRPPEDLRSKCWMYFPSAQQPFYRVTHLSLYSPFMVPDSGRQWSLMCEVSEPPDRNADAQDLVRQTIHGLVSAKIIADPGQVLHTWTHRVEYGYPTPTLGRNAALAVLLPELEAQGILSRGRFGAWKYEVGNMDHSFMQGYEAAAHLVHGSPEQTLGGSMSPLTVS
jgi:protoporphyrinogen oxidase